MKIGKIVQGATLLAGTICVSILAQRLISKMARTGISQAIKTIFD